jgi:hypothetical protein
MHIGRRVIIDGLLTVSGRVYVSPVSPCTIDVVGLLKPFCSEPPVTSGVLPPIRHGHACLVPLAVTKTRVTRGKLDILV